MFIVWGRKLVYRKLGHVADFCPICRKPRPFALQRIGSAGHVYYVSVSQGELVGFERTCLKCHTVYNAEPTHYAKVVPKLLQFGRSEVAIYLSTILVIVAEDLLKGVVFGLLLSGNPLSLYTLYGVIALTGIAVNSAIVLIDAANERRAAGMSVQHAIIYAARRRVVPILGGSAHGEGWRARVLPGGADFQRFLVNPDVDLAPDAPFGTAMLAGMPLAFPLDLDAGAIDQQVQWPLGAAVGDVHGQGILAAR